MTFVFAGLGDCLLHNDILEMCRTAVSKNIDVVLETYGVGSQVKNAIEQICGLPDEIKTHISVVIKFDAYNKETYDKLHKNGNFDEALSNYAILAESGVNVYKCVTRILDNEAEIEQYIRKGETDNLIIRKHSSYCGTIPDQKVVDLSPFQRCPCFHLRRELSVLPTGEVTMCSFARNEILGSIKECSIDEIIAKQQHLYEENAKNCLNNNCKNCDEYYIFNF
jgi:spiro-SPASM protein